MNLKESTSFNYFLQDFLSVISPLHCKVPALSSYKSQIQLSAVLKINKLLIQ